MKEITINVDGQKFPCCPTMGAMLRFKKETGREVTEMKGDSLTDICTYLWCCVKSASSAEGKQFDLPLIDFADRIDQSALVAWSSMVMGQDESEPSGKKKAQSRS
ncbi:MAG: hypothetical protein K2J12_01725 [Muribaculaceae bacterium]|nr:hypothetical protein [Muribaculaceae bacterium]